YPQALASIGHHVGIPNLPILASRFLHEHADSDDPPIRNADLPLDPVDCAHIFHSAVTTYYAPSDPSGLWGMHREHIRANPSWHKGPPRYDCVSIGKDPSAHGFLSFHVVRIKLLLLFRVNWCFTLSGETEDVPCAVVESFSAVHNKPEPETGLWLVEPDINDDGSRMLGIVHIDTLFCSAHLIPAFGEDPV
ncbi:hypothetical protein BC628DRAFT_1325036, partial [Trametes gibbosa]